MNDKSRSYNTKRNAIVNIISQFIILILNFATRKIFIVAFGENYLGISGLFSNILSVLSLAELGVGSAILYCLYKPVSEKDYAHINALINYYKKLYRVIGVIVAFVGIAVVPLLKFIVNIEADIGNITLYYLLYLANIVASYFLVYKTAILTADQKHYIIKASSIAMQIVQFIVLTIVALLVKDYTLYLALHIVFSVLTNVITSYIASRMYPFIKGKNQISDDEKKDIWKNIKALFSYQIGNVLINHTDNILISILVSTIVVGFYSNYSMVVMAVSTFVMLLFNSAQASIGNLAAKESEEQQYGVFKKMSLISFLVTSFSVVGFISLFQDFIEIMYTDYYLMDFKIVIICALNFYMVNILQPVYCYRSTVGLFKDTRMIMIYTAIINIVLSILLGIVWGLFGILIATFISRLLTNFWFEPLVLYKKYFKKSVKSYFKDQLIYSLLTLFMVLVMIGIGHLLSSLNIYLRFVLKILLCILIPSLVYIVSFRKNELFIQVIGKIKKTVLKKKLN